MTQTDTVSLLAIRVGRRRQTIMKAATVPTTAYSRLQRTRHVSRLRRTDKIVPEFTQVNWSRLDDPTVLQHTEYVQ